MMKIGWENGVEGDEIETQEEERNQRRRKLERGREIVRTMRRGRRENEVEEGGESLRGTNSEI